MQRCCCYFHVKWSDDLYSWITSVQTLKNWACYIHGDETLSFPPFHSDSFFTRSVTVIRKAPTWESMTRFDFDFDRFKLRVNRCQSFLYSLLLTSSFIYIKHFIHYNHLNSNPLQSVVHAPCIQTTCKKKDKNHVAPRSYKPVGTHRNRTQSVLLITHCWREERYIHTNHKGIYK